MEPYQELEYFPKEETLQYLPGDTQSEQATLRECVKCVYRCIFGFLLPTIDDDTPASYGFINFRKAHFADSYGGRDTHDRRRYEILGRDAK